MFNSELAYRAILPDCERLCLVQNIVVAYGEAACFDEQAYSHL
jgi:hypothetical protein